jgi:hypothetical protein
MLPIEKLFSNLEGLWHFKRLVSNYGTLEGTALFKKISPNTLHYREEGHSSHGTFFQEYLYEYASEISVYFMDKSLLHRLQFKHKLTMARAEHLCKCDHYSAEYEFLNEQQWRLNYLVRGPKKDFSIQTQFTKK